MKKRRRIIMFNRVTPDGQFARANGALDWVVPDAQIDKGGAAGTAGADTILFGRRTYQMFESFWPHLAGGDRAAPNPHRPGGASKEMRVMADWINRAHKLVFSRTLKQVSWTNARLLGRFNAAAIAALKQQPGKDIMIFGSGSIVSLLTRHHLIDEYHFIVSPLFLGRGRPLLRGLTDDVRLRLLEAKAYKSGNLSLRYATVGAG